MLFQLTASASLSHAAPTMASACDEMAMSHVQERSRSSSQQNPACDKMSLDCQIAMQCVASIGALENTDIVAFTIARQSVVPRVTTELPTLHGPPDSPPPIFPQI